MSRCVIVVMQDVPLKRLCEQCIADLEPAGRGGFEMREPEYHEEAIGRGDTPEAAIEAAGKEEGK